MTFRAIILGFGLAIFIASFTYFNNAVIKQTQFVGNFLPISLFGLLLLAALLVNPLLGGLRLRPIRPGEFLIIAALGLAACAWPGSNFWRYTGSFITTPGRYYAINPAWRAQEMMSYLPDASPRVAPGQVRDWPRLAVWIVAAGQAQDDTVPARLWRDTDTSGRIVLRGVSAEEDFDRADRPALVKAVNAALADPAFADPLPPGVDPRALPPEARALLQERETRRLTAHQVLVVNRAVLDAALPELVLPRPQGGPILVGHGDPSDPVAEAMMMGVQGDRVLPDPRLVPWAGLMPSLGLWTFAALLLGICSLLIAVIVHPQWARRELLAYPIPRFLREVTQRDEDRWLPQVGASPLFWIAFGVVLGIHGLNGLHAWYPRVPDIPLAFDLRPLRQVFPGIAKISLNDAVFFPRLFFTVVGFAYFLPRSVSFSLGISMVLWLVMGALLLPWGVTLPYDKFAPNHTNALRLGAYLGMMGVIVYVGRRYYTDVLRAAALGGGGGITAPPPSAIWAARLLPAALIATVWVLTRSGMDWVLASVLVAVCLLVLIVFSRIVCETGAFLMAGPFMPVAAVVGLMGYQAVGPTGFALVAFAGFLMLGDPREAAMPFLATGLEMADQADRRRVGRVSVLLGVVLIGSIFLAGFVTICLQSQIGTLAVDGYARQYGPTSMFRNGLPFLLEAEERGTLQSAIQVQGVERLAHVRPDDGTLPWLLAGLALVLGCSIARMRIPKWPLHPVIFLLWGTWGIRHFGFSFFVGWALKSGIIQASGIHGFQRAKPLMVGMIAGELGAGLLWIVVGTIHYFIFGQAPKSIVVLP